MFPCGETINKYCCRCVTRVSWKDFLLWKKKKTSAISETFTWKKMYLIVIQHTFCFLNTAFCHSLAFFLWHTQKTIYPQVKLYIFVKKRLARGNISQTNPAILLKILPWPFYSQSYNLISVFFSAGYQNPPNHRPPFHHTPLNYTHDWGKWLSVENVTTFLWYSICLN